MLQIWWLSQATRPVLWVESERRAGLVLNVLLKKKKWLVSILVGVWAILQKSVPKKDTAGSGRRIERVAVGIERV